MMIQLHGMGMMVVFVKVSGCLLLVTLSLAHGWGLANMDPYFMEDAAQGFFVRFPLGIVFFFFVCCVLPFEKKVGWLQKELNISIKSLVLGVISLMLLIAGGACTLIQLVSGEPTYNGVFFFSQGLSMLLGVILHYWYSSRMK